jgi:hypothetical protein
MKHFASRAFWEAYDRLPKPIRDLADKNYDLLKENPRHPSLQFKKVGRFWSVRIGYVIVRWQPKRTAISFGFGSGRTPTTTLCSNEQATEPASSSSTATSRAGGSSRNNMPRLLRTREAIRALYQSYGPAGHCGTGRLQRFVGYLIGQDVFVGLFVHDGRLLRIALSL